MKTSKSKRIRLNRHTGKSHMWTMKITVPAARGRKGNGEPNNRDKFVLSYMNDLFTAFNECLKEINGESKVYHGDVKI